MNLSLVPRTGRTLTRSPSAPRWSRPAHASLLCMMAAMGAVSIPAHAAAVQEVDLVSDIPGKAAVLDPHLVNAWGVSFGPGRPFWISNQGTGTSTLYNADGSIAPLVVSIPAAAGSPTGTLGTPTGQVFSGGTGLVAPNGNAPAFVFATEDGTLSAWQPSNGNNAILAVDNSKKGIGSSYKGLEIASTTSGTRLYAADFRNGAIDVFDNHFQSVSLGANAFQDPTLPSGYAPFNITRVGNQLAVTYALQDNTKSDAVTGQHKGFVDMYGLDGTLNQRIGGANGRVDAPWGVTLAPQGFGNVSGKLLVGNFGDGTIQVFDPTTGQYVDTITDGGGHALHIDGLWALTTRSDLAGTAGKVFFTAGPQDESHGLFGYIATVPEPSTLSLTAVGMLAVMGMARRMGGRRGGTHRGA